MIVLISILISALFAFIIPMLVEIFDEMGWSVGPLSSLGLLFGMNDHAAWWVFMLLVVVASFAILALAPVRRWFTRRFAARLMSPVAQLRTAEMLQMLSIATQAGRPVPASLSTLARYHFDFNFRSKLLFARNEVEQGTDVWTSLADAKLLSVAEARALAVSTSPASRAWAMQRLSQWKRQQVFQRIETAVMFARPLFTLILAAIVLALCVSMFEFLTQSIFNLA